MAKISLDGAEIEVRDGAQLVEVIKQSGTFISNLCYVDGLPPYAGCRTCLVEIEGARGLQLACTSRVQEGMVVRTDTAQVSTLPTLAANRLGKGLVLRFPLPELPTKAASGDPETTALLNRTWTLLSR